MTSTNSGKVPQYVVATDTSYAILELDAEAALVHGDAAQLPSWDNLQFVVPWVTLVFIFLVVYVAALVTPWAPAHRAARVHPAEALRYQ